MSVAYASLGLALCVAIVIVATRRAASDRSNYYAGEVYGMQPRTHRVYAATAGVLGALLLASLFAPAVPAIPVLAVTIFVAIFYFSSFARGFGDEE